jgi:hypothetical protein
MELTGKFNPNTIKKILATGGVALFTVGVASCANGDINRASAEQSWQATATGFALNQAMVGQNNNATPEPNYPATEQAKNNELPNSTSCTLIKKDGNVGDAILLLGAWPDPKDNQAPLGQVVGLYESETAEKPSNFASVDEIVSGRNTSMDSVQKGNEVCVANSVPDLYRPRPAPESSVLPQKARAFRNNGFSPAKGSQAARPQPIRRG